MRLWQFWWHSLAIISRQNPPSIVESIMLLLALILGIVWSFSPEWPYLVLCTSYIVGAIASILVREFMAPSAQTWVIRVTAFSSLLILVSTVGFYMMQTMGRSGSASWL